MIIRCAAYLLFVLACLVADGADRPARGPTTRPTTGPGSVGELAGRATLVGIEGTVQARASAELPWHAAGTGEEFDHGAQVRLGIRSAVLIHFANSDKTVVIDRLGITKIDEAFDLADRTKKRTIDNASTSMPYGRTRYDISEGEVEHQSEIVGQSSTLAIRGEKVFLAEGGKAASKPTTTPAKRRVSAPSTRAIGPTSSAPSTRNPLNSPND
jgi:hypothetical protein